MVVDTFAGPPSLVFSLARHVKEQTREVSAEDVKDVTASNKIVVCEKNIRQNMLQ